MVDVQPQTPGDAHNDDLSPEVVTPSQAIGCEDETTIERLANKLRSPPSNNGPAEKRIRLETTEGAILDEPHSDSEIKDTQFKFGPYVPIVRDDDRLVLDPKGIVDYDKNYGPNKRVPSNILCVLPDDAIVEAPSLVTPLLLKKKTDWPGVDEPNHVSAEPQVGDDNRSPHLDDIQIVKIVDKDKHPAEDNQNVPEEQNEPNSKTKPVEEYVRATAVASLTANKTSNTKSPILTIEDFYSTSAGKLLLGIGLSRVNEYTLERDVSRTVKKIRRSNSDCPEMIEKLESLREQLSQARASNNAYKTEQKFFCHCCHFKSDLEMVLQEHLEKPHRLQTKKYSCNWCDFKVPDPGQVVIHSLIEHKRRCRSEKPPVLHSCIFCSYETNSKRKLLTHHTRCEQSFPHDSFLGTKDFGEKDYPAVTSKFITQTDIRCYEQTLRSLRLATYNPYQLKLPVDQNTNRSLLVVPKQNGHRNRGGNKTKSKQDTSIMQMSSLGALSNSLALNPLRSNTMLLASSQSSSKNDCSQVSQAQLLKLLAVHGKNLDQNRMGILSYPKQHSQSAFVNGKTVINTISGLIMTPQPQTGTQHSTSRTRQKETSDGKEANGTRQSTPSSEPETTFSSTPPNPKGSTFVICEICDAYIKDLTQLKSHMQHIHNVKIHQKMLESRPPLNCQKCQWRFFTDEGIERHLLGVHGLVTSNLQDKVDKGTDSGRCTVCGRAYSEKLVFHMKEVHKTNLKPAHLTYKCTVCLATFNLYRLFENHVYSVHNDTVKRNTGS